MSQPTQVPRVGPACVTEVQLLERRPSAPLIGLGAQRRRLRHYQARTDEHKEEAGCPHAIHYLRACATHTSDSRSCGLDGVRRRAYARPVHGAEHVKFAASLVLPLPLYLATCG